MASPNKPQTLFFELAQTSARVFGTRSRLEKKQLVVDLLATVQHAQIAAAVGWLATETISSTSLYPPAARPRLRPLPRSSAPLTPGRRTKRAPFYEGRPRLVGLASRSGPPVLTSRLQASLRRSRARPVNRSLATIAGPWPKAFSPFRRSRSSGSCGCAGEPSSDRRARSRRRRSRSVRSSPCCCCLRSSPSRR
jgi:hypothetical protein